LLGTAGATPFASAVAQAAGEIIVARDVKIGMRAGAAMHARVFRPPGKALRSTIFSLEADTTEARELRARALAAAGYAVVIATPRDNAKQAGSGDYDKQAGRDGYDAIEWIDDQPWSDRRVVMVGTGEGANAAWSTARERPPYLAAIVSRVPAWPLRWTEAEVSRVAVPTLTIAGSAGEPQGAAIETFTRHTRSGGVHVGFLVVGTLGAGQVQDLEQQWCDWTLGRGPSPPLLRGRVNFMVVTDSSWRSADSFEAIGAVPTTYPLHTDAGPRAPPGGFLGRGARDEEPADTVATGAKSYETLLEAPLDLAGRPAVTLWLAHEPPPVGVASSLPRIASLDEVLADGRIVPLGTSAGQHSLTDSTASAGSGPDRWDFTSFPWIARRLAAGSTLRLTVKGASTVIYHDVERYSRVVLQVVRAAR
jgi:predicted acyl esterase